MGYFTRPPTQPLTPQAYWDDEDWGSEDLQTITVHDSDGQATPTGLYDDAGQEIWRSSDFKIGFDLTTRSKIMAKGKKKGATKPGKGGKGCG